MPSRLFFTLFALIVTSSSSLAGEVGLGGGVKLNLPIPSGFCDLTDSQIPGDKAFRMQLALALQKIGASLLGLSADCQQIDELHAGKRQLMDDSAVYGTPIATFGKPFRPAAVHEICHSLGGKVAESRSPHLNEILKEIGSKIQIGEPEILGILGETDTTCYVGRLEKVKTEIGTEKTALTVTATMSIKDRVVSLNRITTYRADALEPVLDHTRSTVADLESANK